MRPYDDFEQYFASLSRRERFAMWVAGLYLDVVVWWQRRRWYRQMRRRTHRRVR